MERFRSKPSRRPCSTSQGGRGKSIQHGMLVLTNCTFDGHIYNVERVMEECLAIKPDLIFLWDEAWFGFANWKPLPIAARTAMGAAAKLETRV